MTTPEHAERALAAASAVREADKGTGRDYVAITLGLTTAAVVLAVEIAVVAGLWIGVTAVS